MPLKQAKTTEVRRNQSQTASLDDSANSISKNGVQYRQRTMKYQPREANKGDKDYHSQQRNNSRKSGGSVNPGSPSKGSNHLRVQSMGQSPDKQLNSTGKSSRTNSKRG